MKKTRNVGLETAERTARNAWLEVCCEVLATNRRNALTPEDEAQAFALITGQPLSPVH